MTDIVKQLRYKIHAFEPPLSAVDLMEEAADEIERLRLVIKSAKECIDADDSISAYKILDEAPND